MEFMIGIMVSMMMELTREVDGGKVDDGVEVDDRG
jgi:hypothetical protein